MKLLIIGATGQVGQKTVDAALADGHDVTGFGRSTDKIEQPRNGLTVAKGDVTNQADIDAAMPGHDAVILTFGAPPARENIMHQPSLCEDGTRKVIASMQTHGVPRLVCMTAIGAGESEGHGRFVFRNLIEPVLLGRIMKDRTAQEELVKGSSLPEWVIVRPTELSDGESKPVRVIEDLENEPEPTTIARTDVGKFLSKVATDRSWDGKAILVTN